MTPRVRIRVPATSANLGPGFDCLALALDLWNEAEFSIEAEGLRMSCNGEGQNMPTDDRNLVIQAMRFFCDERGLPFPRGLSVACQNGIPVGSGLGSSATAVLLGLFGAAALLDQPLELSDALILAARMEGHADNAAAALYGGLVVVADDKGSWLVRKIDLPVLRVAVVLPNVDLPTHAARAVLPSDISMKDVTFNLGRSILVVEALRSGDFHLLRQAMDDRLHLPYRLPLIPGGQQAMDAAYESGASAVTISGAGPSLIAFVQQNSQAVADAMLSAFHDKGIAARAFLLRTTPHGVTIF